MGDAIAFTSPFDPSKVCVKRVVATGGEKNQPGSEQTQVYAVPRGYVWVESERAYPGGGIESDLCGAVSICLFTLLFEVDGIVWAKVRRELELGLDCDTQLINGLLLEIIDSTWTCKGEGVFRFLATEQMGILQVKNILGEILRIQDSWCIRMHFSCYSMDLAKFCSTNSSMLLYSFGGIATENNTVIRSLLCATFYLFVHGSSPNRSVVNNNWSSVTLLLFYVRRV